MSSNSGLGKLHLDLYTQNSNLTHKAKFWCNYVSALKDRGGLLVNAKQEPYLPHVPVWKLIQPKDIALYDLLYPEQPWKRAQDLRAPDEFSIRTHHPSIVHTLPDDFPDLKHEFSKLESQMFDKPKKRSSEPLTPILPDAHDRIFTPGYHYDPVHTEIYGTYLPRASRRLY
ncbi:uncharacterized protein Mf isoform X1 [Lepeophtheirus salmonis]|uniref:uncharacterized protein Mf isoform X1 n=1 Tax=Lepeophtheirus salmonis TaxID=72036 RepID=UPI001AE27CB6|nr:uncharacterized protein LOC121124177 isoform X1 [Lepeophtheirus salmonis]